jgi:hypothetical protein
MRSGPPDPLGRFHLARELAPMPLQFLAVNGIGDGDDGCR